MQHQNNPQDKRTPARNTNPLNTDFKPGGEEERWPEDPQADEYIENDRDPGSNDTRTVHDDETEEEERWEDVVRSYKIY